MRILHHRQERVERQGDDRRRIADARKRQEKSEHRDRRDRVEKIDDEKRRLRHAVNLGNQNAHRAANHDGEDDRCQRYGDMLQRKLQEKIAALLEKSYHLCKHKTSPYVSKCSLWEIFTLGMSAFVAWSFFVFKQSIWIIVQSHVASVRLL